MNRKNKVKMKKKRQNQQKMKKNQRRQHGNEKTDEWDLLESSQNRMGEYLNKLNGEYLNKTKTKDRKQKTEKKKWYSCRAQMKQ